MGLESWNQITEIAASIAVLASLWFLVIQLRQNLVHSKKQSQEGIVLRRVESLKALYEDHDLSSLIWRGFSQEPRLPAHEWARFGIYLYSLFVVFELTHVKYLAKELEENWTSLIETVHWFIQMPGVRSWWASSLLGVASIANHFIGE